MFCETLASTRKFKRAFYVPLGKFQEGARAMTSKHRSNELHFRPDYENIHRFGDYALRDTSLSILENIFLVSWY